MNPDISLATLRRQLRARALAEQNIHHLAQAIFQEGAKVQYRVTMANDTVREYFGAVVAVCGIPGTTRVRVRNLATLKEREVGLEQITGLVQEE